MVKVKTNYIFIVLVLLGAFLRIFWLDKYPSGFFRDEAALGYNAYSVWQTGRDEYGKAFPIVFRSFEVFFLPAYIYLSTPIVGILGLNEFSTRLLSGLSGIALLVVCYFVTKRIWNVKVAQLALFFLAISPWHIFYSRGAFEGNLGLTFFALGFLFLLKFLKDCKTSSFLVSGAFFALSMYSYQSERLVVPLLALAVLATNFGKILSLERKLSFSVILIFIFLSPLIYLTLKPGGYHRSLGVSIFTQKYPPGYVEGKPDSFFVNNRVFLTSRQILSLYLSYYSPKNLFYKGDANRQRSTENYSIFYIWMAPFLGVGFYEIIAGFKKTPPFQGGDEYSTLDMSSSLEETPRYQRGEDVIKNRKNVLSPFAKYHNRKIVDESEEFFASEGFFSRRSEGRRYPERKLEGDSSKAFLSWIFLAPIPAALTGDPFHTYRSLLLYLPLTILVALGFSKIYDSFKKKLQRNLFMFAILAIAFFDLLLFVFDYVFLTPVAKARDWDWGYKEVINYASSLSANRIVINDSGTESYIHFLFFDKVVPGIYQEDVYFLKKPQDYYYGNAEVFRPEAVGRWEFRDVDWPAERGDKNTIFIFWAPELPESEFKGDPNIELLREIKYPDGTPAYRIVKVI